LRQTDPAPAPPPASVTYPPEHLNLTLPPEDFFALWTNADSNVPVLRQARAEYKNLR